MTWLGEGGSLWPTGRGRGRPEMAVDSRHGQLASASVISQGLDLDHPYNWTAQIKFYFLKKLIGLCHPYNHMTPMKVWGKKIFP